MGLQADQRRARGRSLFFSELTDALCASVEYAVRYETPDENGETRRQRNARFNAPTPDEPEIPDSAEHLCAWFWVLSARRGQGPSALTYAEIGAWARLMGERPTVEEVRILMAMDDTWMTAMNGEIKAMHERRDAAATEAAKKPKRARK